MSRLARRCMALGVLTTCLLAAPASANSGAKGPHYVLQVQEGSTTLPEWEHPNSVYAAVENAKTEVLLQVIHAGLVVGQDSGKNGESASVSPGPQVGDEIVFESPKGTVIARVAYDGLPSMDATVCAGSTNFSGVNTAGFVVEGSYEKNVLETPYHSYTRPVRKAFGEAQVKTLSGTTFGGAFLTPLESGEDVTAVESLKTPLAGEATYTYISETERPVGGCPAPPPVYKPPPPPVLQGAIVKALGGSIKSLLRAAARDTVRINQPGTVVQDLFLQGGTIPASAASRHAKPRALLLARGSAVAKAAGRVTVVLKPTTKGRRRLKSLASGKATLVTTLHSSSGATINLGRRTIKLHR